jgi:hypothetical protein
MVDSVYVLPPGERLTDDSTGAPISGATLYFYDAQTTTPKTVYADADLTVELGTSVVTDSLGYPTSDGAARTLIYVGTAKYKLVAKDAAGTTLFTHDDIPGAVVSASSVDVSVTATFPVVTKSLDYAIVAADQNTTFLVNCSSADVTLTLPSAVDVGNGFATKVQHAGSANQAIIVVKSGSGQNIYEGTKTYGGGSFALALNGEDCIIKSDGGNWRVESHTPPFIKKGQGIIPVVSRLSTSPASPQAGDIYILTGVGGSWSTFTAGDIAVYTGAGWINFTPPTNCGWRAWVQGESLYYSYISSAWAVESATTSATGTVLLADSSTMETATDLLKAVTPGRQHMHPSAAKVWGKASNAGAINASYNMTSVTDTGTGVIGLTIATDFSSANWAMSAAVLDANVGSDAGPHCVTAQTAGTAQIENFHASNASHTDPNGYFWAGFGDQ